MKTPPNPDFQQIFISTRKEKGVTQQNLSNLSGVSLRTIISIENDAHVPSSRIIIKLAEFFGANPDKWLEISGREKYTQKSHSNESPVLLKHLSIQTNLQNIIAGISSLNMDTITLGDIAWILNMQEQVGNSISAETVALLLKERKKP